MKTQIEKLRSAECGVRSARRNAGDVSVTIVNRPSPIAHRAAFTLVELLTVIAVIGIIAGLVLTVGPMVKRQQYLTTARGELNEIATALDNYKAQYGFYPPGNAKPANTYLAPQTNSMWNQLYYELSGVTNNGTAFVTLDNSAQIVIADVNNAYGVGGFINCSKPGDEESAHAKNFLLGLKQNRIATVQNGTVWTSNLVTSVRGPDVNYMPLGTVYPDVNPFRYVYPGVNNPSSYDLWVQLVISGKTNLICNWNKQVLLNNPMP